MAVGILSYVGAVLVLAGAAAISMKIGDSSGVLLLLASPFLIYFVIMGWLGTSAQNVAVGNRQLFLRDGETVDRFPIEEVVSVRTFPVFRGLDLIWIRLSSGKKMRTMAATPNLSAIMQEMPAISLTGYWRRQGR